jgi:DNA ligase-1
VWTEGADICTEYGQVGGKLQTSRKTAVGKNVGRSNETTPEEQAELEAASLHKHKLDRKYSETPEAAQEQLPLPMLAHKYEGRKAKNFEWPGSAQPKLDGVRCLAQRSPEGEILLTSRQGKPWDIPLLVEQLDPWLPKETVLDGEIYVHGETCQRITSWAKSANPEGRSYKPASQQLVYHVYDMPTIDGDDTRPWSERSGLLGYHVVQSDNITVVENTMVASEQELWTMHGTYIGMGYEGAILRGMDGQYLWGYRSSELLKVKTFQDEEFEVISAREGRGKMSGCVVWTCRNDLTNGTFECTMKVPMNERRRMYEERDRYMGKLLTVRFFDRTEDHIPRFPVGIIFRADEDLPK